jgi:hypothetical protein
MILAQTPLAIAFAAAALATGTASAATLNVPQSHATIQGAINAAHAGDTILVDPGTYVEIIDFMGKDVTVQSTSGADVTIIDGNYIDSVVRFHSNETRAAVLRGFTLRNGQAISYPSDGGGIQIYNASPTIDSNIVTASTACSGNGIAAEFSDALITRNHVHHNVTTNFCRGGTVGGGVMIGGDGAVELIGNLIEYNQTDLAGGGVGLNAADNPIVTRNVIRHNSAGNWGGGFNMFNDSRPLFANNVVYGNSADQGGGVYISPPFGSTGGVYANNTIADNTAGTAGSELYTRGFADQVRIENNIVRTSTGNSGMYCDGLYDDQPPITRTNIIHGVAPTGICANIIGRQGNVDVAPAFVGRKAAQGAERFELKAGSPAIDAGKNAYAVGEKRDILGHPRIVDGNGDGDARIDLGAYEYQLLR